MLTALVHIVERTRGLVSFALANAIVYIGERQLPGHVAREEESRNSEKTVIKSRAYSRDLPRGNRYKPH